MTGPDATALETLCMQRAQRLLQRGFAGRRAAVFVDRDGTLVRNVPYNRDPGSVELEPNAARALRCLRTAGFLPVLVTNQSGIARGLCTATEVEAVNARVQELLRAAGVELQAVYVCPHHPDFTGACDCRKPAPGLLLQAERELRLDLAASVLVGDSVGDLEAARRAGVRAYGYRNPAAPAGEEPPVADPAGDWLELALRIVQEAATV